MASNRLTRVNELLKREIAGAFYRLINEPGFDLAAVTVTHVETSSDLRSARVYLSIRGDVDAQRLMLKQVRNHRKDFQGFVGRNVVLKYNPYLKFQMDSSLQEGDRVLQMIADMEELEERSSDTDPTWESSIEQPET